MFNARGESVGDKPSFKRLVDRKRCVVLVDGFYEWKKDASGEKQPFYVHRPDGRPLMLAGLYDTWWPHHQDDDDGASGKGSAAAGSKRPAAAAAGGRGDVSSTSGGATHDADDEEHRPVYSFTILTRPPRPDLAWLHDRQPVILDPHDAELWLRSPGALAAATISSEAQLDSHPSKKQRLSASASSKSSSSQLQLTSTSAGAASSHSFEELLVNAQSLLHCPILPLYGYSGGGGGGGSGGKHPGKEHLQSASTSSASGSAGGERAQRSVEEIASLLESASSDPMIASELEQVPLSWHACNKKMNNLRYQGSDAADAVPNKSVVLRDPWIQAAAMAGSSGSLRSKGAGPSSFSKSSKALAAASASHSGPKITSFFGKSQKGGGINKA